jgi:hypothetical protein
LVTVVIRQDFNWGLCMQFQQMGCASAKCLFGSLPFPPRTACCSFAKAPRRPQTPLQDRGADSHDRRRPGYVSFRGRYLHLCLCRLFLLPWRPALRCLPFFLRLSLISLVLVVLAFPLSISPFHALSSVQFIHISSARLYFLCLPGSFFSFSSADAASQLYSPPQARACRRWRRKSGKPSSLAFLPSGYRAILQSLGQQR